MKHIGAWKYEMPSSTNKLKLDKQEIIKVMLKITVTFSRALLMDHRSSKPLLISKLCVYDIL